MRKLVGKHDPDPLLAPVASVGRQQHLRGHKSPRDKHCGTVTLKERNRASHRQSVRYLRKRLRPHRCSNRRSPSCHAREAEHRCEQDKQVRDGAQQPDRHHDVGKAFQRRRRHPSWPIGGKKFAAVWERSGPD